MTGEHRTGQLLYGPGTRALALHSEPDEVMGVLARCQGFQWDVARSADEVDAALGRHRPEVVFSIKHSGFPGPAHARALAAPGVTWFHVGGAGRDHLGPPPPGVRVTDSTGVLAPFFGERALAGMLALSTGLAAHVRDQAERRWNPTRFRTLAGRALLVVGAGHTGTAFARLAAALGMDVIGVRASHAVPHPPFAAMYGPDELDALLPRADVVSLHLRATPETRGLFGAERFARMRRGALLLNAARGALVDERALLGALDDRLAGAWLDVFEVEPLPRESALWAHPRVVVTPHCADQVDDFPRRFAERFVELAGGDAPPA